MSTPDRRALVDRGHGELSVRRQCQLLGIARSGIYRLRPAANDDDDPALLRRIDELFITWPFLGSRRMTAMLRAEGHAVNRKRVQRRCAESGLRRSGRSRAPRSRRRGTRFSPICCAVLRSTGVAAVEHHGRLVLPRRARGGARPLRHPGDLQHRPG